MSSPVPAEKNLLEEEENHQPDNQASDQSVAVPVQDGEEKQEKDQLEKDHQPTDESPQEHPREGAASLEFRGTTEEELKKEDEEEGPVKHLWDGQDIIAPKDGSWFYCMRRPVWLNSILLLVLVVFGGVEGFLFTRVGIINPLAITKQFTFEAWVVMKIFASVVGASMIFQAAFDFLSPSFFNETRATRYIKNGYLRVAAGGAFIGLGTVLAGSGPTILPAQLGSNVGFSWVTALGMLFGGVLIYVFDYFYLSKFKNKVDEHVDKLTIDEKLGVRYWKLALPFGALFFGFACVLEFAIPGTKTEDDGARLGINSYSYPAIAAGVWVGFNQLVFRLVAHHGEGGSTSYMVFLSLITWGKIAPNNFPNSFPRVWQFAYVVVGIALGGLVGRESLDNFVSPMGVNAARSFLGGMFAIFGAKLGNGCICGASMTGASEGGIEQLVQTIAVFAVGIPAGYIFDAASVPDTKNDY